MQTQEIAIKRNIAPETQIKLMSQLEQSNIARYSNVESLETRKLNNAPYIVPIV